MCLRILQVKREFGMLQKFGPFVTQGQEVIFDDRDRKAHIISELCKGGSLHDRVESEGPLGSALAAKYTQTLAQFLVVLHGQGMLLLPTSKQSAHTAKRWPVATSCKQG